LYIKCLRFQTADEKAVLDWMVTRIPWPLISSWINFWFVTVVPTEPVNGRCSLKCKGASETSDEIASIWWMWVQNRLRSDVDSEAKYHSELTANLSTCGLSKPNFPVVKHNSLNINIFTK
jgi:hypothetical protein